MRFALLSPVALEVVLFVTLSGLLLLGGFVAFLMRTLSLPMCMRCGFRNVRRSNSRMKLDTLARCFLIRPYRCGKCLRRFYCFRSHRVNQAAAHSAGATL